MTTSTNTRPVIVTYTDGSSDDRYDSYAEAVAALESTYEDCVAEHDGDLTDGGDHTLVWADEASSVNDDGANAVASIRWYPRSDAYHTGYEAAAQGEPRSSSEYADGTWEHAEWLDGYDAA